MGRRNRRDCRVGTRKKNAQNLINVEKLKKSIVKAGKTAKSSSSSTEKEPEKLTTKAADFLTQMRSDVAINVEETRKRILPKAENKDSKET